MLVQAITPADQAAANLTTRARRLLWRAAKRVPRPLSAPERQFARTAWAYFATGADSCTGLSPVISKSNRVTLYALGGTLLAITAANRLGLIETAAATDRILRIVHSLAQLPPGQDHLPGLAVDCASLTVYPPAGHLQTGMSEGPTLMRLLAGLVIVAHHYRQAREPVAGILARWNLSRMIKNQRSQPTAPTALRPPETEFAHYMARVAALLNLPWRAPAARGATAYLGTADQFYLETVEFGWHPELLWQAGSAFLSQRARFLRDGHLTSLGFDIIDRAPNAGEAPRFARVSTKVAFGWHAIFPTPYAQKLVDAVSPLARPKGWLAGYFTRTGQPNDILSLSTNAEVLEALHYRAHGPLFPTGT